ncbi:MAG TPA: DivIVA domain-containing protein [Solirubrobacteraceae bacterium]
MELDRQAIERRDFPIGRRGYDPAAVDAHLRALAAEFDELQRAAITGGSDLSMASTAGAQVQGILEAAETAAAEIERNALDNARQVREAADRDAQSTREEAVEKARAHVSSVAQVAASLLERVGSMDGEVSSLIENLRAGASRLAADLAAVETGMAELYDASAGRAVLQQPEETVGLFETELDHAIGAQPTPPPVPVTQPAEEAQQAAAPADLDGARLIALNMALNGESRDDTERYLAENFQLPDRVKLVDEVYAAIEG